MGAGQLLGGVAAAIRGKHIWGVGGGGGGNCIIYSGKMGKEMWWERIEDRMRVELGGCMEVAPMLGWQSSSWMTLVWSRRPHRPINTVRSGRQVQLGALVQCSEV